jgi:RNA polymerase sigma-70 factor (ECF subfamily)
MVMEYQHRLYAFARRLSGSGQDAEDIVQEAFVSAYVSLENYPASRIRALKLQAWLYRVTLNVYTHYKRSSRLHLLPLDLGDESALLEIEDQSEALPETLFERREQQQELENLLARLPERYRVALTCYYFEHLTYAEVADLLGQPIGTIKSNISRGLRLLRTHFTASHPEEGSTHHGSA